MRTRPTQLQVAAQASYKAQWHNGIYSVTDRDEIDVTLTEIDLKTISKQCEMKSSGERKIQYFFCSALVSNFPLSQNNNLNCFMSVVFFALYNWKHLKFK